MASSGNHDDGSKAKYLRVLLPFTCGQLRIPEELDSEIVTDAGRDVDARIIVPSDREVVKCRLVKVWRDDDGAFLGRGWPDVTKACGVEAGWLLVLRHCGCGVFTFKAFDASLCLIRELDSTIPPRNNRASRRPQFISVLPQDSTKKMQIPAKFVQQYISQEDLNNNTAIVISPLGELCSIDLETNQSDVFFAGGWSKFLACHGITNSHYLLLRHEGRMVFTVKIFEPNGCQRDSKYKERVPQTIGSSDAEKQQEAPSAPVQKRKIKNDWSSSEGQKKPKGSMASLNTASSRKNSVIKSPSASSVQPRDKAKRISRPTIKVLENLM